MGTFTMTAQPHTFKETHSHPDNSVCRYAAELFDAKSQLLQSPGRIPVNLDILNSWLRCLVDVCGVSQTDSRTFSTLSPSPVTTGDRPDLP